MKTRLEMAADLVRMARALTAAPQTSASLIALLDGRVDSLLDMRLEIRKDAEALHKAYDDATGGYAGGTSSDASDFPAYADQTVKEARDAMQKLDNEIGTTYRTLENLVRKIKKHGSPRKGQ